VALRWVGAVLTAYSGPHIRVPFGIAWRQHQQALAADSKAAEGTTYVGHNGRFTTKQIDGLFSVIQSGETTQRPELQNHWDRLFSLTWNRLMPAANFNFDSFFAFPWI